MVHSAVPADTDPTAFAILTARWRAMSIGERAELLDQLCHDVEQLARAGIRSRHPDYAEIEIRHELARRRYGTVLADGAYAGLLPRP